MSTMRLVKISTDNFLSYPANKQTDRQTDSDENRTTVKIVSVINGSVAVDDLAGR